MAKCDYIMGERKEGERIQFGEKCITRWGRGGRGSVVALVLVTGWESTALITSPTRYIFSRGGGGGGFELWCRFVGAVT